MFDDIFKAKSIAVCRFEFDMDALLKFDSISVCSAMYLDLNS
jgi:hypothetical protein